MKRFCWILILTLLSAAGALTDEIVLYDDFEGGMGLWQTDAWGLSSQWSISPTHSFSESPSGNYPNDTTLIAMTQIGANLTGFFGAKLEFWAYYQIEPAFDHCYVEASRDGNFWVRLGTLSGNFPFWQLLSYDLGGFAGLPNVRLRFRFVSDPLTSYDGIYVDNFTVTGLDEDLAGPLIVHEGPEGYQGTPYTYPVMSAIWDASGVANAQFFYRLDGGTFTPLPPDSIVGERYYHTIPQQEAGVLVEYFLRATDASLQQNVSLSDTFAYLAGRMIIYDDGVSEQILEAQPQTRAAVRFRTTEIGYVTSALIRIYTDSSHPLDSIAVYVWTDDAGLPGELLGGPFVVYPASTAEDPEAWTWVDLRSNFVFAPTLFHVGCQFAVTGASSLMGLDYDFPPVNFRSSLDIGAGFQAVNYADFHIRAIVGSLGGVESGRILQPSEGQLTLFPNPTNGAIQIAVSGFPAEDLELLICNVAGGIVKRAALPFTAGQPQHLRWQIPPSWASGLYFVELRGAKSQRLLRSKFVYLP